MYILLICKVNETLTNQKHYSDNSKGPVHREKVDLSNYPAPKHKISDRLTLLKLK